MHSTTTGEDIFKEMQKTLVKYNLDWNRLQGVTIDGGRNMSGSNIGVVGKLEKLVKVQEYQYQFFCTVLPINNSCVKHVDMSCVLKPVVSVVNFIRSHALNHPQYRSFLEELNQSLLTCRIILHSDDFVVEKYYCNFLNLVMKLGYFLWRKITLNHFYWMPSGSGN